VKRLKAGPELKMPDLKNLKAPKPLVDLYWDLRDRHLLPVVGLVLVAIVAVPFLLSEGSKQQPPPASPLTTAPSPEPVAGTSSSRLTVVQAEPGLRDYRKRLKDDSPTNPFKQRFTSPASNGAGGEGSGSTSTSTTSTSTVTTTTTGGGGGGGEGGSGSTPSPSSPTPGQPGGGGGGLTPAPGELVYYAEALDVQITHTTTKKGGGKETSGPTVRKRVLPYSSLPSDKVPVVVYMGPNPKTHLPMLLVSDGVASIFGEGKCLSGDETCQLLEVEPGMPETFSYGPNLDRYKLNILKIYKVVVERKQAARTMSQNFSK
jgi:hypothetical protein